MQEKRADFFTFYYQERESVERFAACACLGFLLIAAMSRSVVTKASTDKPETWDYLGGGIDNGFLVIMGPVAILLIALWFSRKFISCLRLHHSLKANIGTDKLDNGTLSHLEQTMITPPLSCADGRSSVLRLFLPRVVFIVGLFSVLILLWEYAQFRPKNSTQFGWLYMLVGEPYLQGFEPVWPRFPGKKCLGSIHLGTQLVTWGSSLIWESRVSDQYQKTTNS